MRRLLVAVVFLMWPSGQAGAAPKPKPSTTKLILGAGVNYASSLNEEPALALSPLWVEVEFELPRFSVSLGGHVTLGEGDELAIDVHPAITVKIARSKDWELSTGVALPAFSFERQGIPGPTETWAVDYGIGWVNALEVGPLSLEGSLFVKNFSGQTLLWEASFMFGYRLPL